MSNDNVVHYVLLILETEFLGVKIGQHERYDGHSSRDISLARDKSCMEH
jgi:hypothetical protein